MCVCTCVQSSSHKPRLNMHEHTLSVHRLSGSLVRMLLDTDLESVLQKSSVLTSYELLNRVRLSKIPQYLPENTDLARDQEHLGASSTRSISRTHISKTTRGTFQTLFFRHTHDKAKCLLIHSKTRVGVVGRG